MQKDLDQNGLFFISYSDFTDPSQTEKNVAGQEAASLHRQSLQQKYRTNGTGIYTIYHKRHYVLPQHGPSKAILFDDDDGEGLTASQKEMGKLWLIVRKV